jgi:hypothetical protein
MAGYIFYFYFYFFCSPEMSLEVGGGEWRRYLLEMSGGSFIWLLD